MSGKRARLLRQMTAEGWVATGKEYYRRDSRTGVITCVGLRGLYLQVKHRWKAFKRIV